jgi:uncharacterized protein (TIGR00730 family)
MIRSVAVFCGSRAGNDPAFGAAATALGRGLAATHRTLIYGGGRVGMMGLVADAVLAGGGTVEGIIPDFLMKWEVSHPGVTDMHVTDTMHDRKRRMFDRADAFVTLPGGLGTLDETIEILTWRQLRLHDKPILICDVNGWARHFVGAIEATVEQGFAAAGVLAFIEVLDGPDSVLSRLDG